MNTDGHYTIHRSGHFRESYIARIQCAHCHFNVSPLNFRRSGDRSGQGRYNRARAAMVKHLHEEHADALRDYRDPAIADADAALRDSDAHGRTP